MSFEESKAEEAEHPEEEEEEEEIEEEGEDEEVTERQKAQRRQLDALYAAAREEFDLDMSAAESAAKTLREGREIQKLSVVRNLGELIDGEPEEAMHKVVPMIQELLSVEPSNLDMHCEAAVVYKNCIKDKKLQRKCPDLPDRLLGAILENIEAQKEKVTAAAWLESLVDIAECVSSQAVINMVVPLAIGQADCSKRVQRRVISTRLIEKLATLVPKEIVQKELSPCAQMLCQDPNAAVRTSIAQKLSVLAQSLKNSTDCCTLLLPCIIQLCKDEDPAVREAILGSMAVCLPHFTKDAKKSVLLPLLRKCSEQALILRDVSLSTVSRHFGSWLQCLKDNLSPSDLRWWLDTYVRILDFAWQHNNSTIQQPAAKKVASTAESETQTAADRNNNSPQQQLCILCRRMCAYNFPCIVAVFGDDPEVFSQRLLPMLERFCRDSDDEVRSIIASGFHEIVAQRKLPEVSPASKTPSSSSSASNGVKNPNQQPLLLGPFVELLSSGTSEVVQQLTGNLHRILPILYKEISASGTRNRTQVILTKLERILLSCNALLRGSGTWRAHESYLNGLAVLRNLVKPKELLASFVPLLKQELLTARALPCRVAAAQSLLLMMREFPLSRDRQAIIDFLTLDIGQHQSCYRRRLLLDIVPPLLQHFSREFFIDKFLVAILKLSTDPISNIRLQLCRTLPKIKQYLVFPNNDESLSSLERVVRELLASEQNALSRQLIQQSACELSRAETDQKECRTNRTKLAEEKRKWTEAEEEEEEEEEDEGRAGSPESGIFEEELLNGTASASRAPRPLRLTRSATSTSIAEMEANAEPVIAPSVSSDTLNAMAIDPLTLSPKAQRRRPPVPPPSSIWRTASRSPSTGTTPKLAVPRPMPQVKLVNQRSSSPMPPPPVEERPKPKKVPPPVPKKPATAIAAAVPVEPAEMEQYSPPTTSSRTGAAVDSARKSKLPLSTGRYRSASLASALNAATSCQPPLFTSGPSPYTAADSGISSVSESVKLKKYRPRDISSTTTMITRKSSVAGSGLASVPSSPTSRTAAQHMTRSASAIPSGTGAGSQPSSPPGISGRAESPIPLQTSASSASLGGGGSSARSSTPRRPYALMRVQSSASAVERKPAQMSIRVISSKS